MPYWLKGERAIAGCSLDNRPQLVFAAAFISFHEVFMSCLECFESRSDLSLLNYRWFFVLQSRTSLFFLLTIFSAANERYALLNFMFPSFSIFTFGDRFTQLFICFAVFLFSSIYMRSQRSGLTEPSMQLTAFSIHICIFKIELLARQFQERTKRKKKLRTCFTPSPFTRHTPRKTSEKKEHYILVFWANCWQTKNK